MHTTYYQTQPAHSVVRNLTAVLIALIITFGLFVVMQKLIENKQTQVNQPKPTPVINLTHVIKESPLIEKTKPRPKPERVPTPIEQTKIFETTPDDSGIFTQYAPEIKIAGPTEPIVTQITIDEGEARPIVRIEPKYPPQAARDGIEGWVKLSFSIGTLGQVQEILVIDSQPKWTFDRQAKRALAKWKYKPQIVAGRPQQQNGMMVVLDFKLHQ